MVTSRMSWYAPPDTGVLDLQLVALERLPSIEGAVEIRMNVTFLQGDFSFAGNQSLPLTREVAKPKVLTEGEKTRRFAISESCAKNQRFLSLSQLR